VTKELYSLRLIVLLSAMFFTAGASAQTSWWRTYGGPDSDFGYSVQQTTDGGYIIVGTTLSFGAGDWDVCLIKTDSLGDTLWTRTYGGIGGDEGHSVLQTSDSGYIIAGYTISFGAGSEDVYLIKTDSLGDTLWTRTYGGPGSDFGYSVQQTTDGGYIIAGTTESIGAGAGDAYLIKTNDLGDTLWTRTYGTDLEEEGSSVQQTLDGGYVIVSYFDVWRVGDEDAWLIKTDSLGDTLWTKAYRLGFWNRPKSVQRTADGGYIITGYATQYGSRIELPFLVKTDAQGDTLWKRRYYGMQHHRGYSCQPTLDGGYIIAGYEGSFGVGDENVFLTKTDSSGDYLWTRRFGWEAPIGDVAYSVQQTTDSGYIIAGHTTSYSGAGLWDVYLIKTDANGDVAGIAEPLVRHPARPTRLVVQPNPFTSFARVPGRETEVFVLSDISGRQVAICQGDRIGAGLRPGIYFLSPLGLRSGRGGRATVIKAAF
jgi:hypothetical protein